MDIHKLILIVFALVAIALFLHLFYYSINKTSYLSENRKLVDLISSTIDQKLASIEKRIDTAETNFIEKTNKANFDLVHEVRRINMLGKQVIRKEYDYSGSNPISETIDIKKDDCCMSATSEVNVNGFKYLSDVPKQNNTKKKDVSLFLSSAHDQHYDSDGCLDYPKEFMIFSENGVDFKGCKKNKRNSEENSSRTVDISNKKYRDNNKQFAIKLRASFDPENKSLLKTETIDVVSCQ